MHAGLVVTAGMTPRLNGELVARGIVGEDLTVRQAREAAGLAAANALAAAASAAGGAGRLGRCVKVTVYIACTAAFTAHSAVADGASEALEELTGGRAAAARTAIGVASLPSGAPVEVELTLALRQGAGPRLPRRPGGARRARACPRRAAWVTGGRRDGGRFRLPAPGQGRVVSQVARTRSGEPGRTGRARRDRATRAGGPGRSR